MDIGQFVLAYLEIVLSLEFGTHAALAFLDDIRSATLSFFCRLNSLNPAWDAALRFFQNNPVFSGSYLYSQKRSVNSGKNNTVVFSWPPTVGILAQILVYRM